MRASEAMTAAAWERGHANRRQIRLRRFCCGLRGKRFLPRLAPRHALPAICLAGVLSLWGWAAARADAPPAWRYDSEGRCDPFVPLVRDGRVMPCAPQGAAVPLAESADDVPVLVGILWDPGGRSLAMIDDREVAVGERVGSLRVTDIQETVVVLTRSNGSTLELRMDSDEDLAAIRQERGFSQEEAESQ